MIEKTEINYERLRRAAIFARWLTFLVLLTMFIGTHTPGLATPDVSRVDKLLHFSTFTLLTFCLLVSWELATGPLQRSHLLAVAVLCALYAALDEVTQIPVGRSCDKYDWVADMLGTLTGLQLFRWLRPKIYRLFRESSAS